MRSATATLVLTVIAAPLAWPQQPVNARVQEPVNARVAKAMLEKGGAATLALCKPGLETSGQVNAAGRRVKVSMALDDLRHAMDWRDQPLKRDVALAGAHGKLLEILGFDRNNVAAWLYLGRAYLYRGYLKGADTAFTKAETLAPSCKGDTERYRQLAWLALVNDGLNFVRANNPDSAKALFLQANTIFRESPSAYVNLGAIYANAGENDSAIAYFKQAGTIAGKDTIFAEEYRASLVNLGIVLNRAKRYDEAIATLEEFRKLAPSDSAGIRSLHTAYCGANQPDKAQPLEKELNLPPCSVAGGDASSLVEKGVAAFNANKFVEAADLFGQAYAKQPYNHDALLNQATSYFKAKNGPKLVAAATPLVELEPMNETALQLLEQGYRETKQLDKQVATVQRRRALPVKLETKHISISPTDIKIGLQATGRDARDPKDAVLKAAPVNLTFELLGADGTVVATQEVTVPPLASGAGQEVTVAAQGNGINGWRYKVKS